LVLGSHWNTQAIYYLFWTHSLCRGCMHSIMCCGHLWNREKTCGCACILLPFLPACLLTLAPKTSSHVVTTRHILYFFNVDFAFITEYIVLSLEYW
jgi:hypothetical protein